MNERKNDTKLSMSGDLSSFFREIVEETAGISPHAPDAPLQEYVVGLLEDSAGEENAVRATVDRPLALLLAEAMAAEPAARFERLRQTGDGILLVGGLYRRHLRRAGLEDRYVVALGRRAYKSASSLLEIPRGTLIIGEDNPWDLLGELASAFFDLMVFLRAVADTIVARAARTANDLARLCEMWLADRSSHLGKLLRARGVMLERAALQMH